MVEEHRLWIAGAARWTARAVGTLAAAVFLLFLFGEGFGPRGVFTLDPRALSGADVAVLSLRFLACLALLLAWRREALGGGIALVCMLLATLLRPWVFAAVLAISAPAALYLLSSILRRRSRPAAR